MAGIELGIRYAAAAAQTVYPILDRHYEGLGLSIAVVPTTVAVELMKATRNMGQRVLQRLTQGSRPAA